MSEIAQFFAEVDANIESIRNDRGLKELTLDWLERSGRHRYTYNFTWLGRPIIQLPRTLLHCRKLSGGQSLT